ncbi:unnamed protein product [Brugia pahangi]|uniref:Uncharacterized protein n=1 Tax=Brugia pahangi TaxID=6280 RepID=A0A0N4TF63_BRUPA|nr:unnamed protein product [Brugia pahangi]
MVIVLYHLTDVYSHFITLVANIFLRQIYVLNVLH